MNSISLCSYIAIFFKKPFNKALEDFLSGRNPNVISKSIYLNSFKPYPLWITLMQYVSGKMEGWSGVGGRGVNFCGKRDQRFFWEKQEQVKCWHSPPPSFFLSIRVTPAPPLYLPDLRGDPPLLLSALLHPI